MSLGRGAPRAVASFEPFKEVLPLQSGGRVSVVSWPRVSSGWAHMSLPHHTTSSQKLGSRNPTLLKGKSRSQAYCFRCVWGRGQNDSKVCQDKQRQKESQESYEKKRSKVQWRKKGRQEGGGCNMCTAWSPDIHHFFSKCLTGFPSTICWNSSFLLFPKTTSVDSFFNFGGFSV